MKVRFLMLVFLLSCGLLKAQIIVPMPVQYEFSELGSFVVDDKTVVEISDESLVFPAQLFSEKVKEMCGLDLLENNRGRKKVKLKINSYMSHPDSYHISVNDKGYSIDQLIDGETVAEVLDYVQYSPKKLVRTLETWVTKSVKSGKISLEEGKEFLSNYRSGLYGYTYLE